ncbi:MAG: DUF1385 domain-containing protein [Saccharofermentanales bacterium]|nr:DUF1385 domain-containing protein [Clostridiaceae bacterium]
MIKQQSRQGGRKAGIRQPKIRSGGRKTTIGGQALIEGLMMIGPTKKAMALRQPDGSILVEKMPMHRLSQAGKIPFLRGSVRLFQQLVSGTKALLRSAEIAENDNSDDSVEQQTRAENPSPREKTWFAWFGKIGQSVERFLTKHSDAMLYVSAVVGIAFSVGIFILLPNFITGFIKQVTLLSDSRSAGTVIIFNLIEGLIRITLFISYLALASKMKDIRRVWMYHGAEHKTIACYEDNQELTVNNVRRYSRFHPRCGTAFMFIVILVSIIVFSFVGWWGRWVNLLIRFALVPLVAGIAYEIIRLAGRFDNRLTRAISTPGLWLQRLTTAEPDDSILEVAIAAMRAVIPEEPQSDRW